MELFLDRFLKSFFELRYKLWGPSSTNLDKYDAKQSSWWGYYTDITINIPKTISVFVCGSENCCKIVTFKNSDNE